MRFCIRIWNFFYEATLALEILKLGCGTKLYKGYKSVKLDLRWELLVGRNKGAHFEIEIGVFVILLCSSSYT